MRCYASNYSRFKWVVYSFCPFRLFTKCLLPTNW